MLLLEVHDTTSCHHAERRHVRFAPPSLVFCATCCTERNAPAPTRFFATQSCAPRASTGMVTAEPESINKSCSCPSIEQTETCARARAAPSDSTCKLISMVQNLTHITGMITTFRLVSTNTMRSLPMMGSPPIAWSTIGATSTSLDVDT